MNSAPLRIGVLAFDEVNGIDLIGPLEAFAHAAWIDASEDPAALPHARPYEVCVIGLDGGAVRAESGIQVLPQFSIESCPALDTLIVPGGAGLRRPEVMARVADWLRKLKVRRLAAVCTGAYGLAAAGLLDGRRVTTHWRFTRDLARRFPQLHLEADAIFVRDGHCYTSGGVTAGIDLALALIEEDLGPRAALAVARELLVYLKRPGGQEQYSEPLRYQTRSADQFAELIAWINAHLSADLSVESLAARVHLSPRQFGRRFSDETGLTPARYVEEARLSEAQQRLTQTLQTVEAVATSIGFASADVFRRAFERRFGIAPLAYRERFATTSTDSDKEPYR